MYFPYLRGRQFELLALRELLDKDLIGEKILPVIEPIKLNSTLAKTMEIFHKKNHSYAMIMNPTVGELSELQEISEILWLDDKNIKNIADMLETHNNIIRAYIVNTNTQKILKSNAQISDLMMVNPKEECIDEYKKIYPNEEPIFSLIPDNRTFIRQTKNSGVLLVDHFRKAAKNADYKKAEDEFFSEDHLYFLSDGFKGFSDYSIIGADFNESGFAPTAVAIHIVYFDERNRLMIHHFVSDSNKGTNDPARKFGEAVAKLIDWLEENKNVYITEALKQLMQCYQEGKYPGLGTVKKLSIMHHLELMNRFLEDNVIC